MAQLANITVKKNDGTTDIVYTGLVPASGDGNPAVWKSQTVGSAQAHQPEFRMTSRDASNGSKRHVRSTFVYPQIATDTTTGVTTVIDRAMFSGDWTLPKSMASADVNEFASQLANLIASTLLKTAVKEGYAPN